MDFDKPSKAVSFVVLSTAELLPIIYEKILNYLKNEELTEELLKNFHILHTTHSLLIAHSTTLNYLGPRIERRLKIKSEKAKILMKEFSEELKKAKTQTEAIIAILNPLAKVDNGNIQNVIDLFKQAMVRMKAPKIPPEIKTVKIGSGCKSRTCVIGGAAQFHIRDKKLARKHGNDSDIFPVKGGETIKDLTKMPLTEYFHRIIEQYQLDEPVKNQIKMSGPRLKKLDKKAKKLLKKYEELRDKYEQVYVPTDFEPPKRPKVCKMTMGNFKTIKDLHDYIIHLRREIARMLAYLEVDKNNRNGTVIKTEVKEFPRFEIPELPNEIEMPKIPKSLTPKSPKCGCPKDYLINAEKALSPYTTKVEMAYGDIVSRLQEIFDKFEQYDPEEDYKKIKLYAKSCACQLDSGEDLEDKFTFYNL